MQKVVLRKFISNRNEKAKINMRKPVYLGQSNLDIIKVAMQKIWFDYTKPKYGNDTQLSLNNSLNKTEHVSSDTERNVETKYDN